MKCKNFLSTLMKLASSGKQSTETAAIVRELVKDLLVSVRTDAAISVHGNVLSFKRLPETLKMDEYM